MQETRENILLAVQPYKNRKQNRSAGFQMLPPVTFILLEAPPCPTVGGHSPKRITQLFEALDYTRLLSVEATRRGQCSLKYNDNHNKTLSSLGKLKVQDQKTLLWGLHAFEPKRRCCLFEELDLFNNNSTKKLIESSDNNTQP